MTERLFHNLVQEDLHQNLEVIFANCVLKIQLVILKAKKVMWHVQMGSTPLKAQMIVFLVHLVNNVQRIKPKTVLKEHFLRMAKVNAMDVLRDFSVHSKIKP